jgi:UDP-N-acetylmuramoylalanine--D-glutamate ligase
VAGPAPARSRRLTRLPRDFRPTELRGQRVLVVGLGTFGGGLGAAQHLLREGAEVIVSDARGEAELAEPLRALAGAPIRKAFGRHPIAEMGEVDWIVASPAVPWSAPPLVEAARRGLPVESEITLLARLLPCRWLGITGTNGKSTTTMLASLALAAGGRRVWHGGNLGGSLLDRWREIGSGDAVALELSSFQLEHLGEIGLGPDVALVTNVTPDHLDRHGTFAEYAAAKRSILARAEAALLQRGDDTCRTFARGFGGRVLWYGEAGAFEPGEPGARLEEGRFGVLRAADGGERRVDLEPLRLPGAHNRTNLLAAAAAATEFGADFVAAATAGLRAEPLARRLNVRGSVDGVLFVDDSVSTSPPAVAAALRAFPGRSRLLVGGYDKGIDPSPLVDAIFERARKAYLYGAVAAALSARLERGLAARETDLSAAAIVPELPTWEVFPDLRAAFAAAAREARPGDTVLFSPGYASYDQFRNFTERGDLFCSLVAERSNH